MAELKVIMNCGKKNKSTFGPVQNEQDKEARKSNTELY